MFLLFFFFNICPASPQRREMPKNFHFKHLEWFNLLVDERRSTSLHRSLQIVSPRACCTILQLLWASPLSTSMLSLVVLERSIGKPSAMDSNFKNWNCAQNHNCKNQILQLDSISCFFHWNTFSRLTVLCLRYAFTRCHNFPLRDQLKIEDIWLYLISNIYISY